MLGDLEESEEVEAHRMAWCWLSAAVLVPRFLMFFGHFANILQSLKISWFLEKWLPEKAKHIGAFLIDKVQSDQFNDPRPAPSCYRSRLWPVSLRLEARGVWTAAKCSQAAIPSNHVGELRTQGETSQDSWNFAQCCYH